MSVAASLTSERASRPAVRLKRMLSGGAAVVFVLYLAMYALYAWFEPSALSLYTFTNLMNNSAPLAIAAAGETMVVLARGFDLSVAGVISLTNVFMALYPIEGPLGALASLAICIAIGAVVGVINGFLVAKLGLQTIAATLGTMIVCQGLSLVFLDAPGGYVAQWVSYELTDTLFGILPISGLIVLAVALLWAAFSRTNTGLSIYAVGADEQAASLSGISVTRTRFAAFVGAGMLYGLAGYMLSAQTATGDPKAGESFLLLAFAAVALGGTSLAGGRGGILGSIFGAGVLMLLQKVLFAAGVSSFYTGMFQSVILVAAIIFGNLIGRTFSKGAVR